MSVFRIAGEHSLHGGFYACEKSAHVLVHCLWKLIACEIRSGRLQTSADEQAFKLPRLELCINWTCHSAVDKVRLKSQELSEWIVDSMHCFPSAKVRRL